MNTTELILDKVEQYLGDIPSFKSAIDQNKAQPNDLIDRVEEMESAVDWLNNQLKKSWFTLADRQNRFTNGCQLKTDFGLNQLPKFESLVKTRSTFCKKLLPEIRRLIDSGEWGYLTTLSDPNKLTTAMLIEGYGLAIESYHQKVGLRRKVVLGLEEQMVLAATSPMMYKDVFDWILEEKDDFPWQCQEVLERSAQFPKTLSEQLEKGIPDFIARQQIAERLHTQVLDALRKSNLPVISSEYRAKSDQRVNQLLQRGRRFPLMDLYGVRIVIPEVSVEGRYRYCYPLEDIWNGFYRIPVFPWGVVQTGEVSGANQDRVTASSPRYSALHQTVVFKEKLMGEVQIMTPTQYQTAQKTRGYYEQMRDQLGR